MRLIQYIRLSGICLALLACSGCPQHSRRPIRLQFGQPPVTKLTVAPESPTSKAEEDSANAPQNHSTREPVPLPTSENHDTGKVPVVRSKANSPDSVTPSQPQESPKQVPLNSEGADQPKKPPIVKPPVTSRKSPQPQKPKSSSDLAIQKLKTIGARISQEYGGENLIVDLTASKAGDAELVWVCEIPNVKQLDLSSTQISDQGIAQLSQLHHLEFLSLADTEIGDQGVRHLSKLPALKYVVLNRTQITDAGLMALSRCKSLEGVSLLKTSVSQKALASFKNQCPQCTLIISDASKNVEEIEKPEKIEPAASSSISPSENTKNGISSMQWKPLESDVLSNGSVSSVPDPKPHRPKTNEVSAEWTGSPTKCSFVTAEWRPCDDFEKSFPESVSLASQESREPTQKKIPSPAVLKSIGETYMQRGEWNKAAAVLEESVSQDPNNLQLRYQLGIALGRGGDVQKAYAEFRQANGDAAAHYNVGVILFENALEKSLEQFERSLLLNPDLKEAKIWLRYLEEQKTGDPLLKVQEASVPFQPAIVPAR